MNISVRVLSASAQAEIKALRAQVALLEKQMLGTSRATSGANAIGGARSLGQLRKFGSQLQWTGRQIRYNFTLPIAVAAIAATKFALDNEKAMTRVAKVYGDTADATAYMQKHQEQWGDATSAQAAQAQVFKNELESLGEVFEALSSHYGINQKEVIETAGAWAAAGASGIALAKSTELSIKAAILGDMDLAKATESLIAIQSQYSLSTKDLNLTLAELNSIENQTGISMQGLIEGFSRAAGSAREYGVDVRHLGAMLAALVPATGSATTAGNALKTIMSRTMAPTKEAAALMKEFGVDTASASWQASNGMDRLMILAKKMKDNVKDMGDGAKSASKSLDTMSDSQRAVVATTLGSRYQVNRFLVLMRELNSESGYFAKGMNATADNFKVNQQALKELNTVLQSSPKRLEILWATIQNGMADAIEPLIPYLIYIVMKLKDLMQAFSNLDPAWQKFIILTLAAVAAVGIIMPLLGSFMLLVGSLGMPLAFLARMIGSVGGALSFLLIPLKIVGVAFGFASVGILKFLAKFKLFSAAGALFSVFTKIVVAGTMLLVRATSIGTAWIVAKWIAAWTLMGGAHRVMLAVQAAWNVASMGIIATWAAGTALITRTAFAVRLGIQRAWQTASTALQRTWAVRALILQAAWGAASLAADRTLHVIRLTFYLGAYRLYLAAQTAWSKKSLALQLFTTKAMAAIQKAGMVMLASPWFWLAAALIILVVALKDDLVKIWDNIISYFADGSNAMVSSILNAWNALPQGVSNALVAVARVVANIAMQIYEWFSYINPFAHHSPSLVENVTKGMDIIKKQFAGLGSIGAHIKGAYGEIKAFGKAVAGLLKGAASFDDAANRAKVKKFAPGALDEYIALGNRLKILNKDLAVMQSRMDKQQSVVDKWQAALDRANKALDRQQAKLDRLSEVQNKWQEKLDNATDRLDKFANAPIRGMGEMSDKIFENEMAQKRLRLEMMKIEDVTGPLDDVKSKIDAINGAQELLRGKQADLRAGGAGGDILKTYDDQIAALEAQRQAFNDAAAPLQNLQDQLDSLARKGEELDLTNSLKFDPLTRQIEKAANAMKEMPFDVIMTGVQQAQADIEKYGLKVDQATDAVKKQQQVVDALAKNRDKMQAALDRESDKLDVVKKKYDKVAEAIQSVESVMNDAVSAADRMAAKMEEAAKKAKKGYTPNAVQNFRDAKDGNFADVAPGDGIPFRKNWSDESDKMKKMVEDLNSSQAEIFGDMNPFGPIQKKWAGFKAWWTQSWSGITSGVRDMMGNIFSGISLGKIGGSVNLDTKGITKVTDQLRIAWANVKDFIGTMVKWGQAIWRLFWPSIEEIGRNAWAGLKKLWEKIGPELSAIFKELRPLFTNFLKFMKPIIAFLIVRFSFIGKVIASVVAKVIKPALEAIGGILANVLQMVRGFIQVFSGIFAMFSGDFEGGFKKLASGVMNIVSGLFGGIGQLIKGAAKIIIGAVWGIVTGIFDWFHWLWDELIGHSIIPDIINGIFSWFGKLISLAKWVFENVISPVFSAFKWLWEKVVDVVKLMIEGVKFYFGLLKPIAKWIWDNVLKPIWDKFKELWPKVKYALSLWWAGIKNVWDKLKSIAIWVWENVLKPVWDKFKDAFDKIKKVVGDAKDNIVEKFGAIKEKLGDVIQAIKDAPGKIKDLGVKFKEAGKLIIDKLIEGFKSVKDVVGSIAGSIWDFLKGVINDLLLDPLRKALVFEIKFKGFGKKFDFSGAIPHLYQGGIVKGSTMGQLAVIGDRGHDEAVVPLSGPYSPFSRLNQQKEGAGMRSDIIGQSGTSTVINIYGNLEFPKISSGDDAEDFITNLKNLAA